MVINVVWVLHCSIEKAVNGHGSDTLAELTCLDKGRGNRKKRRFLILSILSTHVFTSGRDFAGGYLGVVLHLLQGISLAMVE